MNYPDADHGALDGAPTRWWLSFYHKSSDGLFTMDNPWWVAGEPDDQGHVPIVVAVVAPTANQAKWHVLHSFDSTPRALEWRFCDPRPDDWSPWDVKEGSTTRFPRAAWMVWP